MRLNKPMEEKVAASYAEAKVEVERLVGRFACNPDAYRRADYKEAQVRAEFIDPLFEALGWDVRDVHAYAEPYMDVIHEDAIKVGGVTRAPIIASASVACASSSWRPKSPRCGSRAMYGVFGKEPVPQGSFDRYAQDTRRKHGTSEVDALRLCEEHRKG